MKDIPDFEIELSQAVDYIMESDLARKAFDKPPFFQYTNVLRTLVQSVDRLADNCHMPEFTNHALPHICSIVRRASIWAVEDRWIEKIESDEAGYLLLALIVHDIGMLSQDASDLPNENKSDYMKGFADISNWVRRTHVLRIHGLVMRLLKDELKRDPDLERHLQVVICMAESHQKWPWECGFVSNTEIIDLCGLNRERVAAFNAVIAVCDLLDEDASRCDTLTLIKYRHGTTENMAHWIRHALTAEVDGVRDHTVRVIFRKLLPEDRRHEKIYRALRNHYRLVQLYNEQLAVLGAEIKHMVFLPSDGSPDCEDGVAKELASIWVKFPEFKDCIVEQLLSTFMPEALGIDNGNSDMGRRLDKIGLERMDLLAESSFLMPQTVCYPEEKVLSSGGDFKEKLTYIKDMVEEAYLDGQIGRVRHLCYIAWEKWKENVSLNDIYWVFIYLSIFERYGDEYSILSQDYTNSFIPGGVGNSRNKLLVEGDYSYLLDVWFMFLQPCVSEEWLKKYEAHIRKGSYQNINDDFASILLLKNLVGMFWYFDQEGESWKRVADYLMQCLAYSSETLADELQSYVSQLETQNNILFRIDEEDENSGTIVTEPLAKAWVDFWNEDWLEMDKDIPQLCRIANKNKDFMGPVQGYLNMVQWGIEIAKQRDEAYKKEENEEGGSDNFDEGEIGCFRYSRIQLEQPRSSFWQQRRLAVETLLNICRNYKHSTGHDRCRALRLIFLQTLEALQFWDLDGYLDSIRNNTRLQYLLGTYTDEHGVYKGVPDYITDCLISYIRGINDNELHEEERRMAAESLVEYADDANKELSVLTEFITKKTMRIQWKCALCTVDALSEHFSTDQRKQLLRWLSEYHQYYKGQGRFFDSKQYLFLKSWVADMDLEDWEIVSELLDEIFVNQHNVMSNNELVQSIFENAPWHRAIHYLHCMKKYPENARKSSDLYSAIIILSNRKDADRKCLHAIAAQLIEGIKQKIEAADGITDSKQLEEMLCRYRKVERLIDAENLNELEPVDVTEMNGVLDRLEAQIEEKGKLPGFDSEIIYLVMEAFSNQNWGGAAEESVIQIIDRLFALMKSWRLKMSGMYFNAFCRIIYSITNSGTESERGHIAGFVMEDMVYTKFIEEKRDVQSNPLDSICINLGSGRQYFMDVSLLLVTCMKEIPNGQRYDAVAFVIHAMETNEPVFCNYGMVMFSFYYLLGDERCRLLSWGGLQLIKERLCVSGRIKKEIYVHLQNAVIALSKSNNWFGEKGFWGYVEEDMDYKQFLDSIGLFVSV